MSEAVAERVYCLYERVERVYEVAGVRLRLECLDSLDATIDRLFAELEPRGEAGWLENHAPYFGVVWASGQALAKQLGRFGNRLRGKRLLEVGCGLALPALYASHRGARVTAVDCHPHVRPFLESNCRRNRLSPLAYHCASWAEPGLNLGSFDWVVASDVLYERHLPDTLLDFLGRHLKPGGAALIADPERPYLERFLSGATARGYRCSVNREPGRRWDTPQHITTVLLRPPGTAGNRE